MLRANFWVTSGREAASDPKIRTKHGLSWIKSRFMSAIRLETTRTAAQISKTHLTILARPKVIFVLFRRFFPNFQWKLNSRSLNSFAWQFPMLDDLVQD